MPAHRPVPARGAAQFAALGDDLLNARTENRLAWIERLAGNPSEAQRLANDALLRLKADGADDAALERARSYSIFGTVFYDLREWAKAEEYYRKPLQIPQLLNDTERRAWSHTDLGFARDAQKNTKRLGQFIMRLSEYPGTLKGQCKQPHCR